jgi:hypothetical protein
LEENLAVLAEIAVGLAGFSSIVVVFRRGSDSGSWKPEDVARFRIMIEASLVAALFAILPAALRGLGLMNPQLWPIVSALLFSLIMFNTVRRRREGRRLPPVRSAARSTISFSPRLSSWRRSSYSTS